MNDVFQLVATFKDFPPHSYPPSFNPANIMEQMLRELKAKEKLEKAFQCSTRKHPNTSACWSEQPI